MINYCNYLISPNGMKIYFAYKNGKLIVYIIREFEGKDYLLEYYNLEIEPDIEWTYTPINIYAEGIEITSSDFDES